MNDMTVSALRLSIEVSTLSTLLLLPLGAALGWIMAHKQFWGKGLVEGLIHLPLVLPPVVLGYLLLVMLGRRGFLGGILYDLFGIELAFGFSAAVVASMVVALPLLVRSIRLAIELLSCRPLPEIVFPDLEIRRGPAPPGKILVGADVPARP